MKGWMGLYPLMVTLVGCAAGRAPLHHRSGVLDLPEAQLTPPAHAAMIPSLGGNHRDFDPKLGEAIAHTAAGFVGRRTLGLPGYTDDCFGFVRAVYDRNGIHLVKGASGEAGENGVTLLYRVARDRGETRERDPHPGDLVFFRETYDRNRDGRKNDGLTHIAIVEKIESDGTVSLIHRVSRGIARYHMNLARKSERFEPGTGRVLNDYLREGGGPARLAGELFAAFGTVGR